MSGEMIAIVGVALAGVILTNLKGTETRLREDMKQLSERVADHPENYHYLRLDKGNYRRILQAVEAATGLDVEVLEEE